MVSNWTLQNATIDNKVDDSVLKNNKLELTKRYFVNSVNIRIFATLLIYPMVCKVCNLCSHIMDSRHIIDEIATSRLKLSIIFV